MIVYISRCKITRSRENNGKIRVKKRFSEKPLLIPCQQIDEI